MPTVQTEREGKWMSHMFRIDSLCTACACLAKGRVTKRAREGFLSWGMRVAVSLSQACLQGVTQLPLLAYTKHVIGHTYDCLFYSYPDATVHPAAAGWHHA